MRTIWSATLVLVIAGAACGEAPTARKGEDPPMPLRTESKAKVEAAKAELAKAETEPLSEAEALLREARMLQFSDPAVAYDKAKASYEAQPRRDCLWLMGFASCRLRDVERAEYPLEHMTPEDRTRLVDHCAQKGVELTLPEDG